MADTPEDRLTPQEDGCEQPVRAAGGRAALVTRAVLVVLIVAGFGGLLWLKGGRGADASGGAGSALPASITSERNDAVAEYEAALAAGKPIYVLFHSLTCDPCVQISAVADQVVPEFAGRVTFVNAITDDQPAQVLARRFSFQYIPTSFFVAADGTVVGSYTGVLTAEQLRSRLESLAQR